MSDHRPFKGFKTKQEKATFQTWCDMKQRCQNPNNHNWSNYGGRGIGFDVAWTNYANFLSDMGLKPNGLTLERKNNDLGYTKENCCWASRLEQRQNQRDVINLAYNGKTQCIAEWSRELGIHRATIVSRYKQGWPVEMILSNKKFHFGSTTATTAMKGEKV